MGGKVFIFLLKVNLALFSKIIFYLYSKTHHKIHNCILLYLYKAEPSG